MFASLVTILITSIIIYYAGNKFARASSEIGDYFNLPRSVKGATLDAVAGSSPELMIALFSVIFFGEFSIGVGTIAGSVLFNTLIIPSFAVFISPVVFRVGREVMSRDALFYNIAILAFLGALLYSSEWGFALSIVFIAIYFWYVDIIIAQTNRYHIKNPKPLGQKISVISHIVIAALNVVVMGIAAYFLTKNAIALAEILQIPPLIIGFSVVAVATSIPDAIIATVNAKRGRVDDVMSNVFGSNIFNVLIALGLPLFISSITSGGSVNITSQDTSLVIGLLASTIMITYFTIDDQILGKRDAMILFVGYFTFLAYLFYKISLGV